MTPQEQPFDKHENDQPQLQVYIYRYILTSTLWSLIMVERMQEYKQDVHHTHLEAETASLLNVDIPV